MELKAGEKYLYAPLDIAHADSGLTVKKLRAEGNTEVLRNIEDNLQGGLKKLTVNGGQGDGVSALVEGEILTVKESAAVAIANDIIKDAQNRYKKPLAKLTLIQLNDGIEARVVGRATSVGAVMAELGRLQNLAIYKSRVRRR
jgi:hypothetical protein